MHNHRFSILYPLIKFRRSTTGFYFYPGTQVSPRGRGRGFVIQSLNQSTHTNTRNMHHGARGARVWHGMMVMVTTLNKELRGPCAHYLSLRGCGASNIGCVNGVVDRERATITRNEARVARFAPPAAESRRALKRGSGRSSLSFLSFAFRALRRILVPRLREDI